MKFLNLLEFGPPTVTQIPHRVSLDDLSFRACPHGPTSIGAARAAAGAHSVLAPARLPADVGVTDLLELPLGGGPNKLPRTLLEPTIFPGESGVQGGTKYQAKSVEIDSSDALQVGRKSFTMSWALEKGGNRRSRGAPNYDNCSRAHGRTRANGLRGRSPARQPSVHPAAGAGGSAGGTFAAGWQKFFLFARPRFSRVPQEPLAIVRAA